nr:hypothetical protein [Pseudovibrio sp. M1P-2-3]
MIQANLTEGKIVRTEIGFTQTFQCELVTTTHIDHDIAILVAGIIHDFVEAIAVVSKTLKEDSIITRIEVRNHIFIVVSFENEGIAASATCQGVVSFTASNGIVACTSFDRVAAPITIKDIIASSTFYTVGSFSAAKCIVVLTTQYQVITIATVVAFP